MIYARNNPNGPGIDARDFETPPSAAKGWLPLGLVNAPPADANQVAEVSIVIANGVATQQWSLRAKTQAEFDRDDDQADRANLQASSVVSLLRAEVAGASVLTAAQFRQLAARVLLFLVRRAIGGG